MPASEKQKYRYLPDIAAAVCGLALFAYFLSTANRFIGWPDEVFYNTVPQRLAQGDLFFIDEWHLSQLSLIFNVLPYRVFTAVTGGTEGIVLFSRYLFIAIDLLFYIFLYVKLRKYRFQGLCAALLFCAALPQALCAVCYFTVSSIAFTALCVLLFCGAKPPGGARLFFAGVLLACAVLAEPLLIFVFLLYAAAVTVRETLRRWERFAFILNRKCFFGILLGAVSVFLVFMAYLLFSGTLRRLPEALPYLLKDGHYISAGPIDLEKLKNAALLFGAVPLAGLCLALAAAAAYRIGITGNGVFRACVFAAACVFAVWCFVRGMFNAANVMLLIEYHELPLLLFAPVPWLLCRKRDPAAEAFLLAGILFSLFVDIASANVLAAGGRIVFIPCAVFLRGLLRELREPAGAPKNRKKAAPAPRAPKRLVRAAAAVFGVFLLFWNLHFLYLEGLFRPQSVSYAEEEDARPAITLERGPYKGIASTEKHAAFYNAFLRDMDRLKAAADGGAVALLDDNIMYGYLYLDLPYGVPTAWYPPAYTRQLADYWETHPEKRPAYIYVSFYNMVTLERSGTADKLKKYAAYIDFERTDGETGYLLKVAAIHPERAPD